MKTITITAFNRPEYLEQVMTSVNESLRNLIRRDFQIIIGIDPGCSEVEGVADTWRKRLANVTMIVNPVQYGVNWNNLRTYEAAMAAGSEFNVALEDDTPISPDALQLANWFMDHGKDRMLLNLFNSSAKQEDLELVTEIDGFCPWGWCFTREIFAQYLKPKWNCNPNGWDFSVNDIMKKAGLKAMIPRLSRSWNIGREKGVHYTHELYDRDFPPTLVHSERTRTNFRLA